LAVFTARCEARALLWQAGEQDLHAAVDELQAAATAAGLVDELGQDAVQALIVEAFAPVRDDLLKFEEIEAEPTFADDAWSAPGWREAGLDYHRERNGRTLIVGIEPVSLVNRAAASTVEALLLGLRERGTAALAKQECRRRLANLSSVQVREVLARLMALRPTYPAIDDELLFLVGEQL
jgi:hypothetical protein